jgi:formylglycine-generating enzyme required for sulfatase activity
VKIKDWSGALTLIAKLLAAHADDRAALELQARVLKAMRDEASAQAVQAERTRHTETQTTRARKLKQQTDEAIAKEDWAEAARRASAWQVLAPTDTSAAAALTHAQEKLRQSFAFAQDKSLISNQRPPLLLTLAGNVTLELLHIPAGEFLMGSDKAQDSQASNDEIPQHKIYLSDYYIAKYPTTNAQWAAYMGAAKKTFEIPKGKEAHPVVNVTWYEARAFCEWASKATKQQVRLPTEAEWEKGARGADGRIYPWGDKLPDDTHCNFNRNVKDTTPVGRYSPGGDSPYGCVDMAGNVWEWCNDWYDESYYKNSPSQNPTGPSSGRYYRVLRGGSWLSSTNYVRASLRLRVGPSFINHLDVGFRCAYSL